MLNAILVIAALAMLVGTNMATYGITSRLFSADRRAEIAEQAAADARKDAAVQLELATLRTKAAEVKTKEVTRWKTVQKEVDRVVEKPVYRECRLDADGVRVYNAALDGLLHGAGAAGIPADVPVQPPAPAAGRADGRPAAGGDVGLRAVPRLRPPG